MQTADKSTVGDVWRSLLDEGRHGVVGDRHGGGRSREQWSSCCWVIGGRKFCQRHFLTYVSLSTVDYYNMNDGEITPHLHVQTKY